MTSKKNQIRILVVGFIVFLTVSYVLAQGPEKPKGEKIPQENNPPQIVSVEFDNVQNEYTMTVTVVDRDSEFLEIKVQHREGKPDKIIFPQSSMPIRDTKEGTFISDPFSLDPGYHTFVITVADSDDNQVEMSVKILVPESVVQPTDQPLQIVAVGFSNDGNNYTITVEIEDEDPGSVHVEIEGKSTLGFVRDGRKFTFNPIHLSQGLNELTVIARDIQGNQDRVQVAINVSEGAPQSAGMNQPPQIVSVGFSNDGNNYTISVEIKDENPGSAHVYIKDRTDIEFNISGDTKQGTFASDTIALDPGSHAFTITAKDSEDNETSISTSIVVPQVVKSQILVILIPLLFTAIIVLSVFFLSRRPRKTAGLPDYREEVDLLLQGEPKYYETTEPRHYEMETAALKGQLADAKFQLEESQDKYRRLRENIQNIVGQTEFDDLNRIAEENSPERRDISTFIHYLLRAYQELGNLNMPHAKREIRNAIDNYDRFKTSFSSEEKDARSRAEYAYQNALQELKKAHGAFDVKILELFLRKADELIRGQFLYGEKTQNYEASKKLSEAVQSLLEDPKLRARLKKLREAGYIDPVELG